MSIFNKLLVSLKKKKKNFVFWLKTSFYDLYLLYAEKNRTSFALLCVFSTDEAECCSDLHAVFIHSACILIPLPFPRKSKHWVSCVYSLQLDQRSVRSSAVCVSLWIWHWMVVKGGGCNLVGLNCTFLRWRWKKRFLPKYCYIVIY
jgi:hypothetical protein